jgi:ParB/RepB/Spo0J family partition protein
MINKKTLLIDKINETKLEIVYVPTLDIIPNEYNPNTHSTKSFDLLLRSIALFGFTQPIVVDRKTNIIIDGEHRWRSACVFEMEQVPVCFIDLDEEQRRIATIMHNEARGKHSVLAIKSINNYLLEKGINLDEELLRNHENEIYRK